MTTPIAGELEQLLPNFYRLCAPNPGQMTGPGTNTYIYGDKELAIFDAGPPIPQHVAAILAVQDTLAAPITTMFASHTHKDHSPAIAQVAEQLGDVRLIGISAAPGQLFEDPTFKPHHQPLDDEVIKLVDGSVRAIHTPGHVGNHVCYLIEEHQLLTTGDHLMNGSTVVIVPPKGSMTAYVASLKKLQHYAIKVMAPGHGGLIQNPAEVVEWTIQHRLQREAKVIANLTTERIDVGQLVALVYDDVDVSLHQMAELSLNAHLIKLALDGRVLESEQGWYLPAQ
ncbi:MAG: glyoxylase-like metal-dependent hydrolase (beta-lactamase superfamily II) [Cryomorphaceae bacterium]|jgi:glyoxylase-like metal-dependent hydrolase (beta-lactamase superfamily II)